MAENVIVIIGISCVIMGVLIPIIGYVTDEQKQKTKLALGIVCLLLLLMVYHFAVDHVIDDLDDLTRSLDLCTCACHSSETI